MREKYESLSLVVLKDLAKARGLKGISTMKKGELIDRMLQEDEREKEAAPKAKTVYTARTASGQEGRKHTPKPRREGGSQPSGAWRKHACRTWSTCITGTDL